MRGWGAAAAALMMSLAACASPTGEPGSGPGTATSAVSGSADAETPGCPTDTHAMATLLGAPIEDVEGATSGSTEQLCAFSTDAADPGALGVIFLLFPRPQLGVADLAGARRRYGAPLPGHTIVSMPSWGVDAFLDESILPSRNLVAEFAWVPGYEIILGMHADDRHVAERRNLIQKVVALAR